MADATLGVLASYWSFRKPERLLAAAERLPDSVPLFLDSGAFSAHNSGVKIDVDEYGDWLEQVAHVADVYATLDVLGDHEASAVNTIRLRERSFDPLPVFHVGAPMEVLERMTEAHDYLALGAMVGHRRYGSRSREHLLAWLARCFTVTEKHGTKVHGFGLTDLDIMRDFPFASCDSLCWRRGNTFGRLLLFAPHGNCFKQVDIRDARALFHSRRLLRAHGLRLNDLQKYDGKEPLYSRLCMAGLKCLSFAQEHIRQRMGRDEFRIFAVVADPGDFNRVVAANAPVEEWSYERCAAG